VPRAAAVQHVDASVAAAEALWLDLDRWPAFVDGFGRLVDVQGPWPAPGATVVWESLPQGRGRVVEQVVAHDAGSAHTVEVTDPDLTGLQRVAFAHVEDGTTVALSLEYRLRRRGPLRALADVLFIRRALADSLRRTLEGLAGALGPPEEPLR
jgi:hypothetical protein